MKALQLVMGLRWMTAVEEEDTVSRLFACHATLTAVRQLLPNCRVYGPPNTSLINNQALDSVHIGLHIGMSNACGWHFTELHYILISGVLEDYRRCLRAVGLHTQLWKGHESIYGRSGFNPQTNPFIS